MMKTALLMKKLSQGDLAFLLILVLVTGCSSPNRAWEKAKKQHTIEGYTAFLLKYPQDERADSARRNMEEMEWHKTINLGTAEAFDTFLQRFPQGEKGVRVGWNLKVLLEAGKVDFGSWGDITGLEAASIEFALDDAPTLSLVQVGSEQVLKFEQFMRRGDAPARVIFVTPTVKGATAKIPEFDCVLKEKKEGIQHWRANGFKKYPGSYYFDFGLRKSGFGSASVEYLQCFSDGSEHSFYGEVRLFGARFVNDSKEPLVFRIEKDRYHYVSGRGLVETESGQSAKFGQ